MGFLLGFLQLEFRTARYNVHSVLDEVTDELLEVQQHRTTLHKGDAVNRETGLQGGELIEFVQHDLCVRVTFHVDHDTDIAFRVILDIGDTFDLLVVRQFRDSLDEFVLHHAIRQFGDHDALTTIVVRLDVGIRTDDDATTTGLVSILHALVTVDRTTGREIRSLDILHQVFHRDLRTELIVHARLNIIDIRATAVDHLREVMGRHVRRHTYGYTAGTVHQQVRETARQHRRLFERVVEVILHIHGILLDITQHLFCELREARLGITHRSSTIAIDRTEVTLAVYQAITHRPGLRHTHQRTIDRTVTVRVILTHYLTDDTGRFLGRLVARVTELIHTEQHTAVNRLETIAHIRQRTTYDHRHRVVDIRGFHFLINLHRNNVIILDNFVVFFHCVIIDINFICLIFLDHLRSSYVFLFFDSTCLPK